MKNKKDLLDSFVKNYCPKCPNPASIELKKTKINGILYCELCEGFFLNVNGDLKSCWSFGKMDNL